MWQKMNFVVIAITNNPAKNYSSNILSFQCLTLQIFNTILQILFLTFANTYQAFVLCNTIFLQAPRISRSLRVAECISCNDQ